VLHGTVTAGGRQLAGAHEVLAIGSRTGASELADSTTGATGSFDLTYGPPTSGVLYVEPTSPSTGKLVLRSVVGVVGTAGGVAPQMVSTVTVDELTTVAMTPSH
jgi:hypothetical protein